jgi:hypothetical protein
MSLLYRHAASRAELPVMEAVTMLPLEVQKHEMCVACPVRRHMTDLFGE